MSLKYIGMVAVAVGVSACEPGADPAVELRSALEQTLRGAGEHAGDHSWFSTATADALRSVSVDSSGYAIVDFEDLSRIIPNASSSAGSAMLLDELNATVFSVDAVRVVEYRMEGSCERFWEWLQYDCQVVTRESIFP